MKTKIQRENWLENVEGPSDTNAEEKKWTSIWQIRVPSKLKNFLWRLCQDSLPTSDMLNHSNMSTTSVCTIYSAGGSWRDALINCTMARCVWALAPEETVEHMCANGELSAKEWLSLMHETLSRSEFTRMVVTLWAIWKARRKAIHEDIFQSPLSTHGFIISFLADLEVFAKPRRG